MLIDARYKVEPSVVYNGDIGAGSSVNTDSIALQGKIGVAFFVTLVGAGAIALQESDDNTNWTDAPASVVVGEKDGDTEVVITAGEQAKIGYEGLKPYVRAVVSADAAETGIAVIGATIPNCDKSYMSIPA